MIYLDHNATTAVFPQVIDTVAATLRQTGNASSIHAAGRAARAVVDEARRAVATLAGADPKGVIFTSGATEANNTVLQHFKGTRVLVAATEHPSVLDPLPAAERIPVSASGLIDMDALERLLAQDPAPALVSVMLANNETGVIQPVAEIARLAHAHGARIHTDAVQAAGRIALDMPSLGVDYLTLSAHKCGGPQGVGALIATKSAPPAKLLYGGGQERRQRAGTENVAGIAGFGIAATLACEGLDTYARLAVLRDRIERGITGITVFGADATRVANTTCFAWRGVPADTQLMALDLAGICISSGSACSSGSVKPSHVLESMGIAPDLARCALRVSLGRTTTGADIDTFLSTYNKLASSWHI